MAFRVGFDVGGTFTDFALQADDGRLLTGKRLTTPDDPARACVEGLRELVARAGLGWARARPGRARDHARLERRHRAEGRPRRPPDDPGLPRRPDHRPGEALPALRPPHREAGARWSPAPGSGRSPSAWRSTARCWCRSTRPVCAATVRGLRRDGVASHRHLLPPRLREPGPRAARRRDRPRGGAPCRGQPLVGDLAGDPRVRAHVDDRRQRLRDDRGPRLPRAGSRRR